MKKIFYLVIALLLASTSLTFGDSTCSLPHSFRIASMHETTFGSNERYRITSYFLPDFDSTFTTSEMATIEWNGDLYTYVWVPQFKILGKKYEQLMFAVLDPTQATPINLTLLENVTYKLTVGNDINNCEFSIPENSFFWLDIPYATYDQTTRTVSWTPIEESNVYYSIRIYSPRLDGSPNLFDPLFSKSIGLDETHYTLPNAAPVLPGYFITVQAMKITAQQAANFSRDFIRIPVTYTFDGKVVIQ